MKLIQVIIACAVILVVSSAPAQAEVIQQGWFPFEFVTTDDFDCSGEDGLVTPGEHGRDLRLDLKRSGSTTSMMYYR
jgi:hypothetical protein